MRFALSDKVSFEGKPRRTRDGYLVADVRAGRTGIQLYRGDEVGKPHLDSVRVFRPPSEVFDDAAMRSFTSVPVTIDHPPEDVTPDNWLKYARGYTGESIREDGGKFVRVPLILKDAEAIKVVESGEKTELSFGYYCDLDFTPGRTSDGEDYDATQRVLRGNHLAIVSAGRAGGDCRIGDNTGERTMGLKTITQDGIPLEVTDAGAIVIETLNKRIEKANGENLKLVSDHGAVVSAKDAEIKRLTDAAMAKDTEIADLKKKADPAAIDKLVADRATVISQARIVAADVDFTGKTPQEMRRLAVTRVKGADAVKDRDDSYVQALFDLCLADAGGGVGPDPIALVMSGGVPARLGDAGQQVEKAWGGMVDHLTTAWKTPANGAKPN
jgi:hypothetical protein